VYLHAGELRNGSVVSPKASPFENDLRGGKTSVQSSQCAAAAYHAATHGRRTSHLDGRVNDELLRGGVEFRAAAPPASNPLEQETKGRGGSMTLIFGQPSTSVRSTILTNDAMAP
jgi:hypothetical protein